MANDKLAEQSMDFAVQIINLVKQLKEQRESIISNQIGRSGTSIGANIREAKYAHGTADFISKMQIALKEANETRYWLELLYKTKNSMTQISDEIGFCNANYFHKIFKQYMDQSPLSYRKASL